MSDPRVEAIEYLDSLIGSGIRPGLERMQSLLEAAGNPQNAVPAVLVAGTNGKGSTSATISAILCAAGYRPGLYTSPHLVRLEERWRVADRDVDESQLVEAVAQLQAAAERAGLTPTYFEALTILAFLMFERSECDVSILEVGMGGRLDATNVVQPVLSVITPIDFDHQEWLGATIEEIAGEKAGIARSGRPLVLAPQSDAAAAAIRARSAHLGSALHEVSVEVVVESFDTGLGGSTARVRTPASTYRVVSPLAGDHQAVNLTTAIRSAEVLSHQFPEIGAEQILRGCEATVWRGRLESFEVRGRVVLVDGAHNPAGARAAARFVEKHLAPPRRLVFGVLEDKDVVSMLSAFDGLFDDVILTTPDSDRGRAPESYVDGVDTTARRIVSSDADAIAEALEADDGHNVVICGSLYLAGTATRLIDQMTSQRT